MGFNTRVRNKNKYKVKLKSLFKKLFGGLNLVLLLVVVLGFAGNLGGNLKVEAATKSGYFVSARSASEAAGFGATGCEDIGSKDFIFCANAPDPNSRLDAALQYIPDGCKEATCKDGNDTYSGCKPAFVNATVWSCDAKSTATTATGSNGTTTVTSSNKKTLSSNGKTCDIEFNGNLDKTKINKLYLSNCKDSNGPVKDPQLAGCVGFVNKNNEIGFNCDRKYIAFGDPNDGTKTSFESVENWVDGNDGRVFVTSDGGTLFIENSIGLPPVPFGNAVDRVCFDFAKAASKLIPVAGLVFTAQQAGQSLVGEIFACTNKNSFSEFINAMKDEVKGPQSGLVGNIVQGPTATKPGSLIANKEKCQKLTLAQVNDIKSKTDDKSKKQAAQIAKIEKEGGWDGKSDLELCNDGALVCTAKANAAAGVSTCVDPTLGMTDYGANGGRVTNAAAAESKNPLDAIVEFVVKVASIALALVLYVFTMIGLVVLFFFGLMVLYFLDINPAALNFVDVAQKPWGLLASVGNILILGAFMYVGFGYMMGIANMKKNLGDFLLKIIYYAMLLNFTLLGAATIVNVGYGVGNLIKYAYASSSSKQDINTSLMGNIIGPIGKISYLRCPNPDSPECNFKIAQDTNILGQAAGNPGGGITSLWKDSNTAIAGAVAEGVTLIMIGFAIYVFWKALYVVFYRIVALWMLMVLSPIALASYFSPVDEWKSIGKTMFDKFWKLVLFYPCFIFALVLVNTMSGAFSSAARSASSAAKPNTSSALNAASGTGTTPFSISVFADSVTSNPAAAFQSMAITILGAAVAMMGLWAVTKYFTDSFEADMGKIGGGIKAGYEGAKTGFNVAKKGLYGAATPLRAIGGLANKGLKAAGFDTTEAMKKLEKTGRGRLLATGLRTVGGVLSGKSLYQLEAKAKTMKTALWDGAKKRVQEDLDGTMAAETARTTLALRKTPGWVGDGVRHLMDATELEGRGTSREDMVEFYANGEAQDYINSEEQNAKDAVVSSKKRKNEKLRNNQLKNLFKKIDQMSIQDAVKALESDSNASDIVDDALKNDDNRFLEKFASNDKFKEYVRKLHKDKRLSKEAMDAIKDKYISFNNDAKTRKARALSQGALENFSPSTTDLMDSDYNRDFTESHKANKTAEQHANFLKTSGMSVGNARRRVAEELDGAKDLNVVTRASLADIKDVLKSGANLSHDYRSMDDATFEAAIAANKTLSDLADRAGGKDSGGVALRKDVIQNIVETAKLAQEGEQRAMGHKLREGALLQVAQGAALNADEHRKLGFQGMRPVMESQFANEMGKVSGITTAQAQKIAETTANKIASALNSGTGNATTIINDIQVAHGGVALPQAVKDQIQHIVGKTGSGFDGAILNAGITEEAKLRTEGNAGIAARNAQIRHEDELREAVGEARRIKPDDDLI